MNTLARWNDLPANLLPQFEEVMSSYPRADELSNEIFGIGRTQAMAELALC